jgi:hypothetical protein
LAALGVFALIVAAGIAWWRSAFLKPDMIPERAERAPRKVDEARGLREHALERCREKAFEDCLRDLDRARALDPVGDEAEAIQNARVAARAALSPEPPEPEPEPAPTPSASATPAPSASATPPRHAPSRTSVTSEAPSPKPPAERSDQK